MSFDFWRENNFRLEPWGSDYQPPIEIEQLETSTSEIDATVEEKDWSKFCKRRQQSELPQKLIFLDGRRRIDAALVGGSGNIVNYGVFGTIAVGAVVIDRITHTATCTHFIIHRILGFGGNQKAPRTQIPCPLGSGVKLVYEPAEPYLENNPQIRTNLIQNAMLKAEANLASQNYTMQPDTLVIRDGRLSYNSPKFTLGYVKTMHKNYLSEKYANMLWELQPGQRTPIFLVKEENRPHWSWYLKSGNTQTNNQRLGYHDLHGVVRLELSSEIYLETAQKIADQTTYLIPEYSSHPYKDPRAPQNLTPVGALERELGRRMGDPHLIKRRVQHFLASQGVMT